MMKKYAIKKFLLLLILFITCHGFYVIATHIHDDANDHENCLICVLSHSSSAVFNGFSSLQIITEVAQYILIYVSSIFKELSFSILTGRSPPLHI